MQELPFALLTVCERVSWSCKKAILEMTKIEIKNNIIRNSKSILDNAEKINRFDVGYGHCGFALFFHNKYLLYNNYLDYKIYLNFIDRAVDMANNPIENGFKYIDYTEFYCFINNYNNELSKQFNTVEIQIELVEILYEYAKTALKHNLLDPYTGGFLQLHHFVESGIHKELIASVLKQISKNELMLPDSTETGIGITHGTAFYLLFFVRCFEKRIAPNIAKKLIKTFSDHLWNLLINEGKDEILFNDRSTGLNLCYGDMGVVYALIRASSHVRPQRDITILVNHIIERKKSKTDDNSILYGNAGILYYFKMLQNCKKQYTHLPGTVRFWNETFEKELMKPVTHASYDKYNLHAIKHISLLEGNTGAQYIYMCDQLEETKDLIKIITYLC